MVVRKQLPGVVTEWQRYLEAWKDPKVRPVLQKRRNAMDKRARLTNLDEQERPELAKELDNEIVSLNELLSEFDVSVDSFWRELQFCCELKEDSANPMPNILADNLLPDEKSIQDVYRSHVMCGHPVQVLWGSPLQMSGQFMRDVLRQLGVENIAPNDMLVVSVIGAQSSGKSTLMNFLFGCGFATRVGRCTRGLYASYMECNLPNGKNKAVLVLDSEGLLSVESRGQIFDGQMTLMAMACSHMVIINHKGEISRQLQDLLEICMYALKHLRVARLQPKIVFVLRDQAQRSGQVHADMLRHMREHLQESAKKLQTQLDELFSWESTNLFLLPAAFTEEQQEGAEQRWTTALFSSEVFKLREMIFTWLSEQVESPPSQGVLGRRAAEFSTLQSWLKKNLENMSGT